jgi:DNA-binding response OmpR family regulator
MHVYVIDPKYVMARISETACRGQGWRTTVIQDYASALSQIVVDVPDAIVVQGDGVTGAAAHLCQRIKSNAFTAGIPIVHIEEAVPTPWLVTGVPADAVLQMPWDPDELIGQIEMIVPMNAGTDEFDDLTSFSRRRNMMGELTRLMMAQDTFTIGHLSLRQFDSYRQEYGRMGLDQLVVLAGSLLKRHDSGPEPVRFGYLDEGSFVVVGSNERVEETVSNTVRDFELLIPSFYDNSGMFGEETGQADGPTTWVGIHGGLFLAEPGKFDNLLQIGYALTDLLDRGEDPLLLNARVAKTNIATSMAAD